MYSVEIPHGVVDPGPDSRLLITLALAGHEQTHTAPAGRRVDEVIIRVHDIESGSLHAVVAIPLAAAGQVADLLATTPAHADEVRTPPSPH